MQKSKFNTKQLLQNDPRGLIPVQKTVWAHILCLILCDDCGFTVDYDFEVINGLPEFRKMDSKIESVSIPGTYCIIS